MSTTARLEMLKASLEKKKEKLDALFNMHFDDIQGANGQPLNDKRNGRSTLSRWDRQSERIRKAKLEIEKTEKAIEREQLFLENKDRDVPEWLVEMVDAGELTQWKKHPNTFFVPGVDSARIRIDTKTGIPGVLLGDVSKEHYPKFRDVANKVIELYRASS